MKTNHLKVEALLNQAIISCSYDNDLTETKNYLKNALISLSKTTKKRDTKVQNQKNIEKIKKTEQEKWWEMLKKNASNNFNIDIKE